VIATVALVFLGAAALADEPAPAGVPAAEPSARVRLKAARKTKHPREKETEGTEAPDRFEADTVIKSQYELDGKPLEVDPD
jgi:hypothetical protein